MLINITCILGLLALQNKLFENKAKLLDKEAKIEIEAIQAKKEQESAEIQENS